MASVTTACTYDAGDRPTSITDSAGGAIARTDDNRLRSGVLRSAGRSGVGPTQQSDSLEERCLKTPLSRHKALFSVLECALEHGGATTAYTHDAADRPTQITDSVGGTITRTYDVTGNPEPSFLRAWPPPRITLVLYQRGGDDHGSTARTEVDSTR